VSEKPFRILPAITPENEHFWCGGKNGRLQFLRCNACSTFVHPPAPVCPGCLGRELAVAAVSGEAEIVTFTVNHHTWIPGFDPPYVVAIVAIDEQPTLRLTTNIVGCPIDDVTIGMRVEVLFEDAGKDDIFVPLFRPSVSRPQGN
jgi:uncharacterized OB-fold protein